MDGDLDQVLKGTLRPLDAEAGTALWADKIVLNEMRGRIGLGTPRCAAGLPAPRSPGG